MEEKDRESEPLLGQNLSTSPSADRSLQVRRWWSVLPIEPCLFVYVIYAFGNNVVVQQLAYSNAARRINYTGPIPGINDTSEVCHNITHDVKLERIQGEVVDFLIYASVVNMIPATVTTAFLGGLSDTWGRKPVLVLPIVGGMINLTIGAFVAFYSLNVYITLIGTFVDGACGGLNTFVAATLAFVSDTSTADRRSFRFVLALATLLGGAGVASVVCGILIQKVQFAVTLVILLGCATLGLFYLLLGVRETLVDRQQYSFHCTPRYIAKTFTVVLRDDGSGRRRLLLLAILVSLFPTLVQFGSISVQVLYLLDAPRCWSSIYIGYFGGLTFGSMIVGGLVIVLALEQRLGDTGLMLLGCAGPICKLLLLAFSERNYLIFIATLFSAGDFTPVITRSYATKLVQPNEEGSLLAVFGWVELLVLVSSFSYSAIYKATLYWFPGFVFLIMAGLYVMALGLAGVLWVYHRRYRQQSGRPLQDMAAPPIIT